MQKKRLLVIEDDYDLGEMLTTYFATQGYEVFHAPSGMEGIQLARTRFPNMILLDVMLPDMEGFEVCQVLRTTTLTKYIPITFLTQRDGRSDKVAGLELGADDYVTKPFDVEELRLRVERSIKRATREHLHESRTGLPTGPYIESEYYAITGADEDCALLHIGIVGYEAFRDRYGFLTADEAIIVAANIIEDGLYKYGTQDDFVGITERNTFAVFTRAEKIEQFRAFIEETFVEKARTLYTFEDADRGHLIMTDRNGNEKQAPLMHFKIETFEPVAS